MPNKSAEKCGQAWRMASVDIDLDANDAGQTN
jgi:hypothetical protein